MEKLNVTETEAAKKIQTDVSLLITQEEPLSDGTVAEALRRAKLELLVEALTNAGMITKVSLHIGENGNWWIDDIDSGVAAQGPAGKAGPAGPQGIPGTAAQVRINQETQTWEYANEYDEDGNPVWISSDLKAVGETGPAGPQGLQGKQGEKGDKGDT